MIQTPKPLCQCCGQPGGVCPSCSSKHIPALIGGCESCVQTIQGQGPPTVQPVSMKDLAKHYGIDPKNPAPLFPLGDSMTFAESMELKHWTRKLMAQWSAEDQCLLHLQLLYSAAFEAGSTWEHAPDGTVRLLKHATVQLDEAHVPTLHSCMPEGCLRLIALEGMGQGQAYYERLRLDREQVGIRRVYMGFSRTPRGPWGPKAPINSGNYPWAIPASAARGLSRWTKHAIARN